MDPDEISHLYKKLFIAEDGVPEARIGPKLHEVGDSGECSGSFIRARVMIDVFKPLIRGLRIRIEDESVCSVLWSGLRGVGKGTNEERKEAEGDRSFNSAIEKFEESCEVLGSVLVTSGGEGKRHSY
ncbi:hypothetical protein ACOSQ3_020977 [Xanthoceras sorbifolium]